MPTDQSPPALPPDRSIPSAVFDRFEGLAHQAYVDLQQWGPALQLWNGLAGLGVATIESQLAIAHCRIELAADGDLRGIVLETPSAVSNGNRELYLHVARARAFHHLTAGNAARATQLMRLVAAADPHLRRVYDDAILPLGDPGGIPEPGGCGEPLPFQRAIDLDDQAARDLIARYRQRRVLLVIRSGDAPSLLDMPRYVTSSLTKLGISWAAVEAHPRADLPRADFIDRLRRKLLEVRPEIIVYDDLFVSGPAGEPETWNQVIDLLQAQRAHGAKLVVVHPDAWYDGMADLYNTAFNLADLFHMSHPTLLQQLSPPAAERMLCYPFPYAVVDPRTAGAPPQQVRGSFVGSMTWVNPSRLVWCAEMAQASVPVDTFMSLHHGRTPAEFARLIGDYAIGLNFTTRSNGSRILTGRTIEIPALGSLLLEEASADTPYFLRPYEHYVPFATLAELKIRLQQLIEQPQRRARIQQSGTAWARRYFTGLHYWARVFHMLYEVEMRPAVPPKLGKMVRIEIPGPPESVARYM